MIALAMGTLASSNAFAGRADDLVLGTGDAGAILTSGSFFRDTEYNIFYNPAYVNDFKNWGIIEKSNSPGLGAQGGFVASISNFNLGLYFNRGSALNFATFNGAQNFRPVEIMIGSDMGVKWGVGLQAAGYNGVIGTGQNILGTPVGGLAAGSEITVSAGASWMDIEPFVNVMVSGTDNSVPTAPSNSSILAGARYKMGEWIPYAAWREDKFASVDTHNAWLVGLGRQAKLGEGTKMYYAVAVTRDSAYLGTTVPHLIVPIDFSVSTELASWLTGMAGLSYHLVDRAGGTSLGDNTTGRIGMDVHVGKGDIMWAVGKASLTQSFASNAENIGAGNPADAQALDLGSDFFVAAAVGYHW
jgi:hypothetical protein